MTTHPFPVPTLDTYTQWEHKRVFLRVDYNVPVVDGKITDDTRMRETLPTLKFLVSKGARVIIAAHFGRPKGKVNESMRLTPVAEHLKTLLPGVPVSKVDEVYSPAVVDAVNQMSAGSVLVLENVRFEPGEEANDPEFAKKLASLADVYVNDAFGAAHRAHASTEGIARYVPVKLAGYLMGREIEALSKVVADPHHPFVAIIGGSKVSSKIAILQNLFQKVDTLLIGGGMIFTFLKAQGIEVGSSLVEDDYLETAKNLIAEAKATNTELVLATDVVVADAFKADANNKTVPVTAIEPDWMGLDIGPETAKTFATKISEAQTILWNGPLGVFEMAPFAQGTKTVAEAVAARTSTGQCLSVLGGGDTVAAIQQFAMDPKKYSHISTGGGASLEFLEGKALPGIAVLLQPTGHSCAVC